MAKKRTKSQKKQAQRVRKEEVRTHSLEDKKIISTKTKKPALVSIAGDQIHLIKRDLLKTLVITTLLFILLFGIYIYMR